MSLQGNILADQSDLFIYIDGPRTEKDFEKVEETKKVAENVTGFRSKTVLCSAINKGLAKSIVTGTSEVIEKYGKAIVLEDDLFLSSGFLSFMNTMLDAYESDERVFQISGFGTKVRVPKGYSCEYYLNTRAQSWSWATWKDRWDSIDWEIMDYNEFMADKVLKRKLLKSGSELVDAVWYYKNGADIWYICFMYNMFRQNKYCITPIRSLVKNEGFRNDATHTKNYNRFNVEFDNRIHDYEINRCLSWNKRINRSAVKYWTISYRVYGKMRTFLSKLF